MILTNFRAIARATIPGTKASVVTNPVLDLIFNNGARDIAGYTACLKKNGKITVTADDADYTISTVLTDYLVMDKPGIYWNAGDGTTPDWIRLNPRTLKWLDIYRSGWRDFDSGDPIDYSIDGDIITLISTPDTTLADGLWIYYGGAPTDMSAGGHYPFVGSATNRPHLTVFDDAILSYTEWQIAKMLNKGQDPYKAKETAYQRIREEKFTLFKRRPDITADKDAKLQGKKFRS